ncbi:hypothetical protein IFM89_038549 [Coptis chinensis]|uniref:tRNA-uridine aminocarboxypropyltransferase n=1 Tax=Coptis chinensis TaxID=261450 RepID=A0A835LLL3_9MAGN|nr:hypothetical protein IFM89_038549 [Coptis chinensis]
MGTVETPLTKKRPICPSCAKPIRVCLCSRFKSPVYDNHIAVTVLQHDHEKNHPLNSTRIVRLGLKNVNIATCSDVHFEAKFLIKLLTLGSVGERTNDKNELVDIGCNGVPQEPIFESDAGNACDKYVTHVDISRNNEKILDFEPSQGFGEKKKAGVNTTDSFVNDVVDEKNGKNCVRIPVSFGGDDPVVDKERRASQIAQDVISNGFVVKRFLKNQLDGEYEENEEYKIVVPPGTALLFPTNKSIKLEDVDFEVKNLIVLDGTWSKAKRMYHENPWLKLLPHLKLDVNKASLYSEVRQQPKIGCLSTIESIVCAMKALGNDCQELENLLEVFESMVVDQRRCKDESLGKISSV